MYAYHLSVQLPGANTPNELIPVRPGPDLELATLGDVAKQWEHDFGYVPDWIKSTLPSEYIQHEVEEVVEGVLFVGVIEGSTDHVLPPTAWSVAFLLNHGDTRVWG